MRTAISALKLLEPNSLNQAFKIMESHPGITPMAGCTDLYVSLNFGTLRSTQFLNLWGLSDLKKIRIQGDLLSIGSLATYTQIIHSTPVKKWIPMLVQAAHSIGGMQIQNRGTIGGNIANGSPAGDTLPVLAAAEAVVILASSRGTRRVPFNSFYTGYRKTVMQQDELILSVEIPKLKGKQWFRKVGARSAQAISKIVMAAVSRKNASGKNLRIGIGSVAPTVIRLYKTEEILAQTGDIAEAQKTLCSEIQPIDDLRSTAYYRKTVAANLLAEWWEKHLV
ncbi:MAG: xanthine dehydrogenase family protein subunit M [Firmicutes bacterium]|nr:xanthine dehydrogenase family protein subunit M [Bacillota bacterium]